MGVASVRMGGGTQVPNGGVVRSVEDAARVLRHAERLATLLSNQANLTRNSVLIRLVLLQHVFLSVVPLPLPINHPERHTRCFWAARPVRYETQHDILGLLRLLSYHYAAAAMSVPADRHVDALRVLTAAAMAAMADAAARIIAVDIPSPFSLHYAGEAPGPTAPFGFTMRKFAQEAEALPMTFPEHVTALTQVLDYFDALAAVVKAEHVTLDFSAGMKLSAGDGQLLTQLCLQMGYPTSERDGNSPTMPLYFTGENPELVDEFPEMLELRDVVFLAKLLLVPVLEGLPDVRLWRSSHAKLVWKYDTKAKEMTVVAFGDRKLDPSIGSQLERGGKVSFWASLFSSGQKPRCPPSGANPTALTGQQVVTEDDVLHIRKMPDLGASLKPAECELLLTYLTAPYVRIPLVLQFFAAAERVSALAAEKLQAMVEAVVFEPGSWLPPSHTGRQAPAQAPDVSRGALATPCGLLFNELACSPHTTVDAVVKLLTLALDLDSGKWTERATRVLLFVIRLTVHVESYMLFLLRHAQWRASGDDAVAQPGGFASIIRGLATVPGALDALRTGQVRIRELLVKRAAVVLQRYLGQALQVRDCARVWACLGLQHNIHLRLG
jgi:hypothetical protein